MELLSLIILACQLNVASKYPTDILALQFTCQQKLIKCLNGKTKLHIFNAAKTVQAEYLGKCIEEK